APAGTYAVRVTASDDGCPVPKQAEVLLYFRLEPPDNHPPQVAPEPASYGDRPVTVTVGDELTFDVLGTDRNPFDLLTLAQVAGAPGMVFQSTPARGEVRGQFSWQPDCEALAAGLDTVRVGFTVSDGGCFASVRDTAWVTIHLLDRFSEAAGSSLPNVFSPNGDGINDRFVLPQLPEDNCTTRFQSFEVFNRWGVRVYRQSSPNVMWDGSAAPAGVYYYQVRYTDRTYKGSVTLLR
ncbi:MAG: gliding motility-associated C-terminal domain-containing protein, partial [Catalinimonas sp.]